MKKTPILLICALSLSVPGLAAAAGKWGTLPSPSVPTQTRPRLPHPGPHARACDLSGTWREAPYSKAWGDKRLSVAKRNGPTLIQYRVQQPGIRGEVHEVLSYNAKDQSVEVFTYARPNIFSYASGQVSGDCRHISLTAHANNFSTRRSRVDFVRR